jgi:molybdopterin biosynthesis enzyme
MRVTLEERNGVLYANPTGAQGSNLLTSLVWAQGLAICPENISELSAGDLADVQLLDWVDSTVLSNLMMKGKG